MNKVREWIDKLDWRLWNNEQQKLALAIGVAIIALCLYLVIDLKLSIIENAREYHSWKRWDYYYKGREDGHVYVLSSRIPLPQLRKAYVIQGATEVVKSIDFVLQRCGKGKQFYVEAKPHKELK